MMYCPRRMMEESNTPEACPRDREAASSPLAEEDLQLVSELPAKLQDSKLSAEYDFQNLREKWQKRRRKEGSGSGKDAAQRLAQSSMQLVGSPSLVAS